MDKVIIDGVEYTDKELAEAKVNLRCLLKGWDRRYKLVNGNVVKRELSND